MPDWLTFASVSGAVTILAFIAECLKAFPKFAEFRRGFLLISFGFFMGSLLTAISGAKILLSPDGSPLMLLMAGSIGLGLLFLFLGVMSERSDRKIEFYVLTAVSAAAFVFFLMIYGSSGTGHSTTIGELSFAEKIWVGDHALASDQNERAIEVLEDASNDLPTGDPRAAVLAKKIKIAKERQLQRDMEAVQ